MEMEVRLENVINRLHFDMAELEGAYQELKQTGGPEKKEGEEGFDHYAQYYNLSLAVLMAIDKLKTEAKILTAVRRELR